MMVEPHYLLPPSAYRSAAWFEWERATLFTHRWSLVADEGQLATPGDYVAATVGDAPLVVVRGEDGELRAHHNICRHRGMAMLEGEGRCERAITCFYHQWRYGFDGGLKVVPQRKEQFPDLDLGRVGPAPGLGRRVGGHGVRPPRPRRATARGGGRRPAPAHMGSHRPGALVPVARVDLEAACNWKLFVENHIDVYHLWYLHEAIAGRLRPHPLRAHDGGRRLVQLRAAADR